MVLGARVQTVGKGIAIDLDNEVLRDGLGAPIELRNQAFEVLRYLVERSGQLATKNELMEAVWPNVAVTDDSLVQCIHEIRRALGDHDRSILRTVARRGYRFIGPAEGAPGWPRPLPGSRREQHAPAIAVLPFANLSKDPDQRYFADGITEDLITDLSRISGVMVIARNSVWPYRDQSVDVHQVAERLGVQYLLEGSVRREGGQVRINAQLIDAADGHHLWANRYDGALTDVFRLQDSVIASIVSALSVELTSEEAAATSDIETTNIQAYDALLLGMEHLHRDTEEATLEAISLFSKAAELDPLYSQAYAAIAAAQLRIVLSIWTTTAGTGLDGHLESLVGNLARAMEKPTALSYRVAAVWASQIGQYDEAFSYISKALALSPNDPEVLSSRARILNASGRAEEAEADLRIAMRLDPRFTPATLRILSITQFNLGRYQEAIATVGRIRAQGAATTDEYLTLTACLGQLGRTDGVAEAIDSYNALALPNSWDPMTVQEALWYWSGDLTSYHRPYVDKLAEGLQKAGVPPGAGMDIPFEQYMALYRRVGAELEVEGTTEIDVATARAFRGRGVAFVDVRAHLDYANGHVPGAVNLSLVVDLSRDTLAEVAGLDDEVAFYCHSRYCSYHAIAAAKALIWGHRRVYRFAGGFPAWVGAGYPVEVSEGPH